MKYPENGSLLERLGRAGNDTSHAASDDYSASWHICPQAEAATSAAPIAQRRAKHVALGHVALRKEGPVQPNDQSLAQLVADLTHAIAADERRIASDVAAAGKALAVTDAGGRPRLDDGEPPRTWTGFGVGVVSGVACGWGVMLLTLATLSAVQPQPTVAAINFTGNVRLATERPTTTAVRFKPTMATQSAARFSPADRLVVALASKPPHALHASHDDHQLDAVPEQQIVNSGAITEPSPEPGEQPARMAAAVIEDPAPLADRTPPHVQRPVKSNQQTAALGNGAAVAGNPLMPPLPERRSQELAAANLATDADRKATSPDSLPSADSRARRLHVPRRGKHQVRRSGRSRAAAVNRLQRRQKPPRSARTTSPATNAQVGFAQAVPRPAWARNAFRTNN